MYKRNILIGAALVAAIAACGGATDGTAPKQPTQATEPDSASTQEATPAANAGAEPLEICKQVFARQKECTSVFIPALVDLRIEHDVPPGIAGAAQQEGRDALIETAMQEWENDSAEPVVAQHCEAMVQKMPAEHLQSMLDTSQACLAQADCQGFVDCIMPMMEQHLTMQAQAADTP